MDDFVALGRQVCVCVSCNSRYGDWWKPVHYTPVELVMGDCDGCGEPLVSCVKFGPEPQTQDTERIN
jgi:hypothetical protein